jgi:hypothetical protein
MFSPRLNINLADSVEEYAFVFENGAVMNIYKFVLDAL